MSEKSVANPKTGEIIPARFLPPAKEAITKIARVAGKNIEKLNLRDHPELNGHNIIISEARVNAEGSAEYGNRPFVVMVAWVFQQGREPEPDDVRMVVTGSDNIYFRVLDAINAKALPISGVLRKSGRAWFID